MKILITGTARLGKTIAATLTSCGHCVIAHSRNSQETLKPTAGTVHFDFMNIEKIEEFADSVFSDGSFDGLIHCAAGFERTPEFSAPAEMFERMWKLNTLAPILLEQSFYKYAKKGFIINILDQRIDSNNLAGCMPYALSKKNLRDFTLAAAKAWCPKLRVNAIAPGAVLPPPNKSHSEKSGDFLCERPTPEHVATAAKFLIETPSITGQILYIDGGQHLL